VMRHCSSFICHRSFLICHCPEIAQRTLGVESGSPPAMTNEK
jgi:hypothetical protein